MAAGNIPYGPEDVTRLLLRLKEGLQPGRIAIQGDGVDETNDGCVWLIDFGRQNDAVLVVRGELRGQVWLEGDMTGFGPWSTADFTQPTGFFEFFRYCFIDQK